MTANNPHPLANPYNTCRFGNFNIDRAVYGGYLSKTKHPQQLTVPQSKWSYDDIQNYQKSLTVPNQLDIPMMHKSSYNRDWEQTESIASILNKLDSGYYGQNMEYADPNLSEQDIKYWQHANSESKKLKQSMNDDQKQLLKQVDSGEFFRLSRLELEK